MARNTMSFRVEDETRCFLEYMAKRCRCSMTDILAISVDMLMKDFTLRTDDKKTNTEYKWFVDLMIQHELNVKRYNE